MNFKFGNLDSSKYSIVINKLEGRDNTPERQNNRYNITGRNGDIITDFEAYKNKQINLSFYIEAGDPEELNDTIIDFNCGLSNIGNYANLTFTDRPNEIIKAIVDKTIDVEYKSEIIAIMSVTFSCLPYKYTANGSRTVTVGRGDSLYNPTGYTSSPEIIIDGIGDIIIVINGKQFDIKNLDCKTVIDTELLECYEYNTKNVINRKMIGAFPVFTSGANTINFVGTDGGEGGTVTSFQVTPRWRYL